MGRLVRRTEPRAGERWHNRHSRFGDRPGRAAWIAEQGARFGSALDRGHAGLSQTNERKRKMKITASNRRRGAGLSAMVAGLIFAVVGLIHPPQIVSSVTTSTWTLVHVLTIAMSFFGLLGIAGIYARQVEKAGWMGLAGCLLLSLWFVVVTGFSFFGASILPLLTRDSPEFGGRLL